MNDKNTKSWLTVQITDDEADKLKDYCKTREVSKTSVIRDFINNLEVYEKVMRLLQKRAMNDVLHSIENNSVSLETEEIENISPKKEKEPSLIPEEMGTQIDIPLDDLL